MARAREARERELDGAAAGGGVCRGESTLALKRTRLRPERARNASVACRSLHVSRSAPRFANSRSNAPAAIRRGGPEKMVACGNFLALCLSLAPAFEL